MFWKENIVNPYNLNVIFKANRFIATKISLLNEDKSFIAIFIYAPPNYSEKEAFWKELMLFVNSLSTLFIIIGDYNEIGAPHEKIGGAAPNSSRFKRITLLKSNCNILDIPFSGQVYTWRKKVAGENNIWERLDRVMASPTFIEQFPTANIKNHLFTSSDHCQVQLSFTSNTREVKATPFRFEKQWTFRKDFLVLVAKIWNKRLVGSNMYCFTQKCKLLKNKAKEWSKNKFGKVTDQIRKTDAQLNNIQPKIIDNTASIELISKYNRLLKKRHKLIDFSTTYWQQRSKIKYLKLGDQNNTFFHRAASIRKNRNMIKIYTAQNNSSSQNPNIIRKLVEEDFKDRFKSDENSNFDARIDFQLLDNIITPEDNYELCAQVSDQEIHNAVFQLDPDKSPGPDGYPPLFFQKYWGIIGKSVIRSVKAFFHSGKLLKEVNHTFIALIPKIENPSSANHFRPISLCSTMYKIISKILVNRLKQVLGKIVHPLQGAFVPDRLIQDNILMAHEVFHAFRKKTGASGWIAIKLDMEKAYDRLEWGYIFTTLEKLGFCQQWIDWIRECVSTVSFSVIVNGIPSDQFFPSRGIRQGDPLSPYLFILCAELLARQLQYIGPERVQALGVRSIRNENPISHLC